MRNIGASGGTPTRAHDDGRLRTIERVLAAVRACLREAFPDDFYRRCAYAAFAIRDLLRSEGMDAALVGGQFAALVVTPDGARMAIQGFDGGSEPFPHLWVEADGLLVDLGLHLLPFGCDYPVTPMPALTWDMSAPLPPALRYKVHERFAGASRISPDPEVRARNDAFAAQCRARTAAGNDGSVLGTWIVSDNAALHAAAERGDPWASGVRRFEPAMLSNPLPF